MLAVTLIVACGGSTDGATDTGGCEWPVWTGDDAGCAPSPLPAQPPDPTTVPIGTDGHQIVQDLTYRETPSGALLGDLYLPPAVDPEAGILVLIHGGGWEDCGRRRDAIGGVALVMSDVLRVPVFNVEYRLRQEGGGYPANLEDVRCAAAFVGAEAASYGAAPGRVALMGESAGAHLALMTAMTGDRPDLACGPLPEVTAVVAFSPPADLPGAVADDALIRATVERYTDSDCDLPVEGCVVGRACDRCVDASPLAHACDVDAPLMLVQAPEGLDPFVALSRVRALAEAVELAGGDATLVVPSAQELADAGCPEGAVAHGFVECLTTAAGGSFVPFLADAL